MWNPYQSSECAGDRIFTETEMTFSGPSSMSEICERQVPGTENMTIRSDVYPIRHRFSIWSSVCGFTWFGRCEEYLDEISFSVNLHDVSWRVVIIIRKRACLYDALVAYTLIKNIPYLLHTPRFNAKLVVLALRLLVVGGVATWGHMTLTCM